MVVLACAAGACLCAAQSAGAMPKIAFAKTPASDQPSHIWTVAADASGLEQLTSGTAHDLAPAWSPGHGTIAFIRSRSGDPYDRRAWIMLMRANGTNKRKLKYSGPSLTSGARTLAFSHDGCWLAGGASLRTPSGYGRRWAVTILDLKTHRSRIIYRFGSQNGVVSLSWSPYSGQQLVACTEYGGGYRAWRIALWSRRARTSFSMTESVSWKPGGNRLLCCQWFPGEEGAPTRTLVRRLDGTQVAALGEGQHAAVFSPDAGSYAFLAYAADGSTCLQVADFDGSDVRTVYAGAAGEDLLPPAWW
jgi:WD40 repeat protein